MTISLAEKQLLAGRIQGRINERISVIQSQHADEVRIMEIEARDSTLQKMGLDATMAQLESINAQIKALEVEAGQVQRHAERQLGDTYSAGVHRNGIYHSFNSWSSWFEDAIRLRYKTELAGRMSGTDWGRQIQTLKDESENLADTVLVAGSSNDVRIMWTTFNQLLGLTPMGIEAKLLGEAAAATPAKAPKRKAPKQLPAGAAPAA